MLIEIITIIAPIFLIKLLGWGLGKTSLFPAHAGSAMIAYVWYVAIPALMFRAMASHPLPTAEEVTLLLGYYGAVIGIYSAAMVLSRLVFGLPLAERSIFALSACFANGGFVGIPLMEGAFGEEGVRLLLVILSIHSLTLVTLTTVFLEHSVKGDTLAPPLLSRIVRSITHNPLLIALVLGLSWSALNLPFPLWLDRMVALPAVSAAPVGLFAAGMALSNVKIAGDLRHASLAVVLKLVALPLAVFGLTYGVLDLPRLWVAVATLTAALPTGMMVYSYADRYAAAPRRAATIVLVSTGISAFSLSLILFLLQGAA